MLQSDQVEPRLREITRLSARLEELLAAFNRDHHSERPQDFLLWLEAERHLSRAELARLMDADQITVTSSRSRYPREARGIDDETGVREVTAIGEGSGLPTDEDLRYVILGHAGRGGMATVHVARDTELMRKVAFKSLLAGVAEAPANDVELRDRFLREVQITAQLDHPYIVPVYSLEVGPDGNPAYTMKLIEGCTFAAYLDDTRSFYVRGERPDEAHDLPTRLEHFLKVCDAMHYAHGKGIVHRDLKPANVMIGRHNEVYVMDWGICRMMSEAGRDERMRGAAAAERIAPDSRADASQTLEGSLMGTPRYMSPEQANGRLAEVGPASDQCALGLILFEVVTLEAPFAGDSMVDILKNAARGVLRPITHGYERYAVPRELAAIIRKAAAVNPSARYADVGALADDLRRYLRGAAVLARPDSLWQAAGRWVAQHRQLALLSFVVVLALAIAIELLTLRHEHHVEKQALLRERGLIRVMDALNQRRERFGDHLLHAEAGLQRFAAAAEEALIEGQGSNDRFYVPADLAALERTPSAAAGGLKLQSRQNPAVWTYPAAMSRGDAERRIRRLASLHDHRLELLVNLGSLQKTGDSGNAAAFVGMALATDDGLTWTYPGRASLPANFDARRSAWYATNHGADPRWLGPYVDAGNAAMLVVVSALVREVDEQQLGVAALQLSAEELRHEFLRSDGIPNAARVVLLDAAGNVLLDGADRWPLTGKDLVARVPQAFPDPALIATIQATHNGYRETVQTGRRYLAAYSRLPVAGWSIVALVDDAALLAP